MTVSRKFLRNTHLISALVISLYLMIASLTGAILGIDEALKSTSEAGQTSVAAVIAQAKAKYPELSSLKRNKEEQLELQAFDADYNEQKGFLDLSSGKIVQKKPQNSKFINWTTTLHRSLFLDNTGRMLAGILSVLFLISLISGIFYLLKNQGKISDLFLKWIYASSFKTYHLGAGRLFFLPLTVVALTASILFFHRYGILKTSPPQEHTVKLKAGKSVPSEKFALFQKMPVTDLVSIQFPFDETEPYLVETKTEKYQLNASTGQIISQTKQDNGWLSKNFSYDIHTGKINPVWAWVAAVSALSIPGFIVTGFGIFVKRKRKKIGQFSSANAGKVVILYGSENGSTRDLAISYSRQLQSGGAAVFLGPMNEWQHFPKMQKLLILTATYGDGEAPGNADQFLEKITKIPLKQGVTTAVVGFGSSSYQAFNQFAKDVRQEIIKSGVQIPVFELIDEHNSEQIHSAEKKISRLLQLSISSKTSHEPLRPIEIQVKNRVEVSPKNGYFQLELEGSANGLTNGDLILIQVPGTDHWRHYSVAVLQGNVHLFIKKVPDGLASTYLSKIENGAIVTARPEKNSSFHFKGKEAILISNGTGIAPFLGMINSSQSGRIKLYAGFRYREIGLENLHQNLLPRLHPDSVWAYSGEEGGSRITTFLRRDAAEILAHLQRGNEVMICGSLALKHEVEEILQQEIDRQNITDTVEEFYLKKLLKADCY